MLKFQQLKKTYDNATLLFRVGDFYEAYFDDAPIVAKALGLTLTSRDRFKKIPMTFFPYYQLDDYTTKLAEAGFKTKVCEV